ncbi:MAG: D-alanine--D-alanine ligase, partial [Alphaproteobacteria bacterium]|nr:D-alanine--D-alanine ligase [Alphaproteobacteria bacterium]
MNRIAVLMGGVSAEREVSLTTGRAVCEALTALGYTVDPIDVGADIPALATRLTPAPDAAFNALHGRFGEDGCIQGLLELMGIPYTHSGIRASALAMNKAAAKAVFQTAGITVPEGEVVCCGHAHNVMPPPYVVKPVSEGSSVGVVVVEEGSNAVPLTTETWPFGDKALVEQ